MSSLEAALAALKLSESPNYAYFAKEFGVDTTTLVRRYKGTQLSLKEVVYQYRTLLSKQQTKDLINYINKLSVHSYPSISIIVQNFAFNILKKWPGKN